MHDPFSRLVSWEELLPTKFDAATARAEGSTFCELMLGSMTLPVLDLFCGVVSTVRLLACSAVAPSSIRARSANAWRT
jgi:hypothetical protein